MFLCRQPVNVNVSDFEIEVGIITYYLKFRTLGGMRSPITTEYGIIQFTR